MSVALDQPRLAQLAAELGDRHAACEAALSDALGHAISAGGLLLEAKGLVARGEWQGWLADHFAGSKRTARGYMQLAREDKRRPIAARGVRAALAAIAAPQTEEDPHGSEARPDAEDHEVLREVVACRRLTDGALEVGFVKVFAEAVASGHAEASDREHWSDLYYRDPDTMREVLREHAPSRAGARGGRYAPR